MMTYELFSLLRDEHMEITYDRANEFEIHNLETGDFEVFEAGSLYQLAKDIDRISDGYIDEGRALEYIYELLKDKKGLV